MKKNTFARRLAFAVLPIGLVAIASGCAVDTQEPPVGEEAVGQTSQALSTWAAYGWGTTNDLDGHDTGLSMSTWTCMLAGAMGNLSEGTTADSGGQSRSGVGGWLFDTTWHVFGHGGRSASGAFIGNPVMTAATCVPHPRVASATWSGSSVVAPPVKITELGGANRRCFLTSLTGSYEHWNSPTTSVARVARVATTDASHPTTGYYVEGTEVSEGVSGIPKVSATCVDFPVGTVFQTSSLVGTGASDLTINIGTAIPGVKACALTEIRGRLDETSWSSGVHVQSPTTASGTWTLRVSPGRTGTAVCAR